MLAIGRPGEVALYVGSIKSNVDWPAVLGASLPGSELLIVEQDRELRTAIASLPAAVALTGNPCCEAEDHSQSLGPVEMLAQSLANERWAYAVLARPMIAEAVHQSLRSLRAEREETASNFQRRGSAEEQNHPRAQHLLQLLLSTQQQHELAVQVGMWKIATCLLTTGEASLATAAQASTTALARGKTTPQPLRCRRISATSPSVLTSLNSVEASQYAALPSVELAGVGYVEPIRFSVNSPSVHSRNRLACGVILDQRRRTLNWFEVNRDDLTRHTFISGATGSGKTLTCQYLLHQLWLEHRVPWLVIEPAMKSEYRAMLSSELAKDLRIYTPGKAAVAPLRINPLERVEGVAIDAHIDSLVGLFSAAFGLVTPLPFVLRLALQRLFEEVEQPILPDLQRIVRATIAGLGYQGEIGSNLRAALELRLQTMNTGTAAHVLGARSSTPIALWLEHPTVIELSSLGDDTTRALIMGALLLRLVQERQKQGLSPSLRHVAVIEEAHRLLGRRSPRGDSVDAQDHAAEGFAQLLAEVRAFGQGLMVVDQSPAKLIPDVIRNTQLKIVHRLTSSDDQSAAAAAMGLNELQRRVLTRLGVGEAVAFSTRSHEPSRIVVPNWLRRAGGEQSEMPDDRQIAAHMRPLLTQDHPVPPTASCDGCPMNPNCKTARIVQRHLLERDESASLNEAVASGLPSLLAFGGRVANDMGLDSVPQVARCVVLQAARAIGASRETIEQLRERLTEKRHNA